ncbi:NHLP family bacteriocin export ABC transporter peptidase/permease/ATPase subunit [Thiocystis minor]|nr:NHLP family bacteriocin export ABC transporter peptidase/permease/ATPase subunit [Thiocystis minor]
MKRQRPVKTPTILQMEALECGAAALAMVLAYHGRWLPLEELRVLCGVSRDGSKAVNLLKAARSLGMEAKGQRREPAELANLPVPAILFVNMNHFVVFEGVVKQGFRINDPGGGRRVVDPEEFDGMFSGILLAFTPGADFQRGGRPQPLLPRLLEMTRTTLRPIALVLLAGALMAVFMMLMPALQRIYLDKILIGRLDAWVYPLLAVLAVTVPLLALLSYLRLTLVARIGARLSVVLSTRLVWHVLRLPVPFFVQRYAGMVSSRIGLADVLAYGLSRMLAEVTINLALLLLLTLLLLQYSLTLTLICVGLSVVNVLLFRVLQESLKEVSEKVAMAFVKMQSKVMQGLRMMETLKATGTDDLFFAKWSGLHTLYVNAEQKSVRRTALIAATQTLTATLTTAAVLVVGGYYTMIEDFSIGMLVAFSVIAGLFTQPVAALVNAATQLQDQRGNLAQIDDTLRYPQASEFDDRSATAPERATTTRLKRLSGCVTLDAVAFGYAPLEPPLIEGFSLDMAPGSRVALVGASGSGKSTVGRLVSGLMEPRAGAIRFDGVPLHELPRDILRNSLAVVDQEIVLFEGSIRDNITLWDDTMPHAQMVAAAEDAMIHELIMTRPGGYDAWLEENGRNLSGGQRQRLEIARALVGNPSILVLDEATSALDAVTEKAVIDNLLRRGCTCLIIAHRLSSIRDCDEIIVLDRGRILQRGTHEALIAEDGAYRRLIET